MILCEVFFNKFKKSTNLWDLARACSSYRKCGLPVIVIEITQGLKNTDFKAFGAILTTRGGAYRDIRDYRCATDCAEEAISYDTRSFYPCNLMGGILFDQGQYELGLEFYRRAIYLGSKISGQDNEIRTMLKDGWPNRKELADFLYRADPVRFNWAPAIFINNVGF